MARKLASDRFLFGAVVLLVATGLLMIYSASAMQIYLPAAGAPARPWFFVVKQAVAVFLGALLPCAGLSGDYRRRDRILAFLHPEADRLGRGFHAIQSLIAVGTGGVTGLGLGHGKQKLFFLPYPYTDFIFAIVGEELGLIGCVFVLALFGVVFAR